MTWQKIDWWSEKISLRKRHLNRMYMDNDKVVSHMKKVSGGVSQAKGTASVKALRGKNIDIKGLGKTLTRLRWSKRGPL